MIAKRIVLSALALLVGLGAGAYVGLELQVKRLEGIATGGPGGPGSPGYAVPPDPMGAVVGAVIGVTIAVIVVWTIYSPRRSSRQGE